jgi:hypothetical protein
LFPSAAEGKNFKNEEQRFHGKKKGRELYGGRFGAKMEGWKD